MNRRDFLSFLGLSAAVTAVNPSLIVYPPSPAVEVFKDYPRLHFTGLKAAQKMDRMSGQFLWTTEFKTLDDKDGQCFWYSNVIVDLYNVRTAIDPQQLRQFIRSKLQNGSMSVARMMDEIIDDAETRHVACNGSCYQIPNPDFDPSLPATSIWDTYGDEDYIWNPKTIDGDPIKVPIKSLRLASFDNSLTEDGWDIDRLTNFAVFRLLKRTA